MKIRLRLTGHDAHCFRTNYVHQTDLNQAEHSFPAGLFAASGRRNYPQSNLAGKKKARTMNPLIQLKKAIPPSGFSSPRAFMALLLCMAVAGSMLTGTMLAVFRPEA